MIIFFWMGWGEIWNDSCMNIPKQSFLLGGWVLNIFCWKVVWIQIIYFSDTSRIIIVLHDRYTVLSAAQDKVNFMVRGMGMMLGRQLTRGFTIFFMAQKNWNLRIFGVFFFFCCCCCFFFWKVEVKWFFSLDEEKRILLEGIGINWINDDSWSLSENSTGRFDDFSEDLPSFGLRNAPDYAHIEARKMTSICKLVEAVLRGNFSTWVFCWGGGNPQWWISMFGLNWNCEDDGFFLPKFRLENI